MASATQINLATQVKGVLPSSCLPTISQDKVEGLLTLQSDVISAGGEYGTLQSCVLKIRQQIQSIIQQGHSAIPGWIPPIPG